MARFGTNLKISLGRSHQARAEHLFRELLGCALRAGPPGATIVGFAGGETLGLFWVDDAGALSEAQHEAGTWLEFAVDDGPATADALERAGIERIRYAATPHAYFRIPGGPVFRLA